MTAQNHVSESMVGRLIELLGGYRRLIIVGHDNPDPDFLASAIALKFIAKSELKLSSVITCGGMIGRAENRSMVRLLKIKLNPISRVRFGKTSAVVLIDTQPGTGNNSLPENVIPQAVIDHHPRRRQTNATLVDIRTDYGATSTILTEYIRALRSEPPAPLATALAYAIVSETRDLSRETGEHDIEAYLYTLARANKRRLARIIHPKVSRYYFTAIARALNNAFYYRNVIGARLGEVLQPDVISQMADLLLSHERMSWVICSGFFDEQLLISVRNSTGRADSGRLMKKVVGRRGTAGGHELSAGAQINCSGMLPSERLRLEEVLIMDFIHRITRQKDIEPKPLIQSL